MASVSFTVSLFTKEPDKREKIKLNTDYPSTLRLAQCDAVQGPAVVRLIKRPFDPSTCSGTAGSGSINREFLPIATRIIFD
jgi:hypothetical protein